MSTTRYVNPEPVPERVGWRYEGTLKDETGAAIPASAFSSLTIRIYVLDVLLTDIVASPVSILNADRGTLHATSGKQYITFTPDDSAMVDATLAEERRVALVEGVYATTRKYAREIEWRVKNMDKRV